MIFKEKEFIAKDGAKFVLKSPEAKDSEEMLRYLKTIYEETEFMVRYPEEIDTTVGEERKFLINKQETPGDMMITVFRDGKIVENASLNHVSTSFKARHRGCLGIAIVREYWHMGLGRELMTHMITAAREFGYEQLELEVASCNENAISLYKKMGFVICGECPHAFKLKNGDYYNEYHMVLNLTEKEYTK